MLFFLTQLNQIQSDGIKWKCTVGSYYSSVHSVQFLGFNLQLFFSFQFFFLPLFILNHSKGAKCRECTNNLNHFSAAPFVFISLEIQMVFHICRFYSQVLLFDTAIALIDAIHLCNMCLCLCIKMHKISKSKVLEFNSYQKYQFSADYL